VATFFDGIDRGVIMASSFHLSKMIFMAFPNGYALKAHISKIKKGMMTDGFLAVSNNH
jgi:hypothetical protein